MGDRTPDEIGALDVRTRGAKNGVCPLDSSSLVPLANIPTLLTGKTAENATNATNADTVDAKHAADLPGALVWEKIITGSAVTSVTTNGEVTLDGNVHGGYEFEWSIVNTSGLTSTYRMYYNNDTTNANYYYNAQLAARGNDAVILGAPAVVTGVTTIGAGKIVLVNGIVGALYTGLHHNYDWGAIYTHYKIATITNLTRIDITSSIASGIGINSRFRLWRRI